MSGAALSKVIGIRNMIAIINFSVLQSIMHDIVGAKGTNALCFSNVFSQLALNNINSPYRKTILKLRKSG